MFESSVVLDGTKTSKIPTRIPGKFESSVVLDGTKPVLISPPISNGLRVVLF